MAPGKDVACRGGRHLPGGSGNAGGEETTGTLTLRIGFLEGVAGVHEVGGRVVLALQLQVEPRRLAEGVPCGCGGRGGARRRGKRRDGAGYPAPNRAGAGERSVGPRPAYVPLQFLAILNMLAARA